MALPDQLKTARISSSSLASTIPQRISELEAAVGAILGLPLDVNVNREVLLAPWGSRNLTAVNNTSLPLSQYDIDADTVLLRHASQPGYLSYNPGAAITCNILLSGPIVNGRDQVSGFISTFVHFYWIYNPTTQNLSTIASATAPPTGPTLPSGYTHWCYATSIRADASGNLLRTRTRGNFVWYEIDDGGVARVVNEGQATTFTQLNLDTLVPAIASLIHLEVAISAQATAAVFNVSIRPTGSVMTNGLVLASILGGGAIPKPVARNAILIPPGTPNQAVDYKISSVPTTSGGAIIDVLGYYIPNGG